MSDLFKTYESDFIELKNKIKADLNHAQNAAASDDSSAVAVRSEVLDTARRDLEEMESTLESMKMQIRSIQSTAKPSYSAKVASFQTEYQELKNRVNNFNLTNTRSSLFGGESGLGVASLDSREKFAGVTSQMEKNNDVLQDSERILQDTIGTGEEILVELDMQRERISGMRDRMGDIKRRLGDANIILKKMGRILMANKLILIGIILFLVVVIGVIVYFKFFFFSDDNDDGGKHKKN